MFLERFAYPCPFVDMVARFGRPVPQLSMITNRMLDYLFGKCNYLLAHLNQSWLSKDRPHHFAATIYNRGALFENCWALLDGTVRPLRKPDQNQRMLCNGHKRVRGINVQCSVASNELIVSLFGPVEGRRHDSVMLVYSGLLQELSQYLFAPYWKPLCVYGDPAFPLRSIYEGPS